MVRVRNVVMKVLTFFLKPVRVWRGLLLAGVLVLGLLTSSTVFAKVTITHSASLPTGRAGTPLPTDPNVVFYIQRSLNRNVVVYQAQLDAKGQLASSGPLKVFWRRFAGRGNKRGLKFFERHMAYGVSTAKSGKGQYKVKFAAYSKRRPILKLDKNGRPIFYARAKGQDYRLIFAYVHLRGKGTIPNIAYIDLVGQNLASKRYVRVRVHDPLKIRGRRLGLQ